MLLLESGYDHDVYPIEGSTTYCSRGINIPDETKKFDSTVFLSNSSARVRIRIIWRWNCGKECHSFCPCLKVYRFRTYIYIVLRALKIAVFAKYINTGLAQNSETVQ